METGLANILSQGRNAAGEPAPRSDTRDSAGLSEPREWEDVYHAVGVSQVDARRKPEAELQAGLTGAPAPAHPTDVSAAPNNTGLRADDAAHGQGVSATRDGADQISGRMKPAHADDVVNAVAIPDTARTAGAGHGKRGSDVQPETPDQRFQTRPEAVPQRNALGISSHPAGPARAEARQVQSTARVEPGRTETNQAAARMTFVEQGPSLHNNSTVKDSTAIAAGSPELFVSVSRKPASDGTSWRQGRFATDHSELSVLKKQAPNVVVRPESPRGTALPAATDATGLGPQQSKTLSGQYEARRTPRHTMARMPMAWNAGAGPEMRQPGAERPGAPIALNTEVTIAKSYTKGFPQAAGLQNDSLNPVQGKNSTVLLNTVAKTDEAGFQVSGQVLDRVATAAGSAQFQASAALPEPARQVVQQITAHIDAARSGEVEITLSPKELGTVRLVLSATESGLQLSLSPDRAETYDLIRRHLDAAERAFRDFGFTDLSIGLASRDPHHQRADSESPDMREQGAQINTTETAGHSRARSDATNHTTGLDIRV